VLRGSSQAVPGDPYTLWVYIPDGLGLSQARASVPVKFVHKANSLNVTFQGQREPVDWQVKFTTNPKDETR
jgi:hypothetical protein